MLSDPMLSAPVLSDPMLSDNGMAGHGLSDNGLAGHGRWQCLDVGNAWTMAVPS